MAVSIFLIAKIFENIYISGFMVALWAAIILGIANTVIRPILLIFTLPINIISLGLFTFVVNGIILKLTAGIVPGFKVIGLFGAIIGSIVLSIVNIIISEVLGAKED